MGTIRNKRTLVRRTQWHADQDHVVQGTYGSGSCNGQAEFQGCAIGCMATPHTTKGLRAFIKRVGGMSHGLGEWSFHEEDDDQLPRITKEFGVSRALARVAETLFEAQPTHGAAINFIPKFARALPEGVKITDRQVQEAWKDITGCDLRTDTFNPFHAPNDPWGGNRRSKVYREQAEREFFAWLRKQGR